MENSTNPKFHASSNALNFNPCGYTFSIPSSSVIETTCHDEELEYFNVRNCRQQHQRPGGNVDNVKLSALPELNLSKKLFQNISTERGAVDIRSRQTKMPEISTSGTKQWPSEDFFVFIMLSYATSILLVFVDRHVMMIAPTDADLMTNKSRPAFFL